MGTVHAFDPRPERVRPAPFFIGLAWAFAAVAAFWSGIYLMTRALYG